MDLIVTINDKTLWSHLITPPFPKQRQGVKKKLNINTTQTPLNLTITPVSKF